MGSLPLAPDLYNLDLICRSGGPHTLDYVHASVQLEDSFRPENAGFIIGGLGGVLVQANGYGMEATRPHRGISSSFERLSRDARWQRPSKPPEQNHIAASDSLRQQTEKEGSR